VARKHDGQRPGFEARLGSLRKAGGYTQRELAQEFQILDALMAREQLRATRE